MKTQRKLLRAYFCTHLDSVRVHGSFLSSSSIEFGSLLFVSIMSNSNRKLLVEAHSRIQSDRKIIFTHDKTINFRPGNESASQMMIHLQ